MSRVFAYCRVSTAGQQNENQRQEIKQAGFAVQASRVMEECISGSSPASERPGFCRLLDRMESGDVLVVTHAVARAICHGQKGEIRKRYQDGQEEQLGALGLVTNAVVLWNTIYMQAALAHLRDEGEAINEDDESRLSPLRHAHINMLGHYTFTLAEQVTKGQLRPLKQAEESDEWPL